MTDFYKTPMGARYFGHTLPELSRNVGRVADLLERLVVAVERATPQPARGESDSSIERPAR